MSTKFDVVAVGNAIVDVLKRVDEAFLEAHAIARAGMTLIDEARADALTAAFGYDVVVAAGGSAANTVAGVASFGGRAAFLGKVAEDEPGRQFTIAARAAGVAFETAPMAPPPGTARCMIAVTPDGQRSMSTYLGASTLFASADIDRAMIEAGEILFLEGYLFDKPAAKDAFVHAAEIARAAGRKVALTLSDTFCVDRHRDSFRHLVQNHMDIVFANEAEILSLYETESFDAACAALRADCELAAVTRSALGSLVMSREETHPVPAQPTEVIDTTGAGDLYAAGFLFGLARGRPLPVCGKLGAIAAAEVISHMGPRPERSLAALAEGV